MEAQPLSMEHHPNENNTTQVTFLDQGYCLLSMQTNVPSTESVKEVGGDHEMKEMMVEVQLNGDAGNFSLLEPANGGHSGGLYDKPLSCFGCGIGWFSFVLGFAFPPLWYYATVLYFGNYYLKDPRERAGLAASAIAALICSIIVVITLLAVFC